MPNTVYKIDLPRNCPPADADEAELVLYRMLKDEKIEEHNFKPYVHEYPDDLKYKSDCHAHGISFFAKKENAIKKTQRHIKGGVYRFIAKITIKKDCGKIQLSGKKFGHYTLWFYKAFDLSKIECLEIIPLNGDGEKNE